MKLSGLSEFPHPSPRYEQYQTPPGLAARLLYHAFVKGDIQGKRVCDLGSGTGIFSIGAALLGAEDVVGVELDGEAIRVAKENAIRLEVGPRFIQGDLRDPGLPLLLGTFDTVVMNPPFGSQNAHADRPFLDTALGLAGVVYGIFNAGSRDFVASYIHGRACIDEAIGGTFSMKRTFFFHKRETQDIAVEILRLRRVES
jgi:putative methylase